MSSFSTKSRQKIVRRVRMRPQWAGRTRRTQEWPAVLLDQVKILFFLALVENPEWAQCDHRIDWAQWAGFMEVQQGPVEETHAAHYSRPLCFELVASCFAAVMQALSVVLNRKACTFKNLLSCSLQFADHSILNPINFLPERSASLIGRLG
jgi:hypothetical protein